MEEKNEDFNVPKEELNGKTEPEGSYFTGILGAIIGGIIGAIPWVLLYVYQGLISTIVAMLITICEFYGYKLFKGKFDKKLPAILIIISIIIVVITTLLVIPAVELNINHFDVSMKNIKTLYADNKFESAIIKDCITSIIFTAIGAIVIASSIGRQINNGKDSKNIKIEETESTEEAIGKIKPIFEKYGAFTKETGILQDQLNEEIKNVENGKQKLNLLTLYGVVRKKRGRYYFNEKDATKLKKNRSWIWFLLLVTIVVSVVLNNNNTSKNNNNTYEAPTSVSDGIISFEIDPSWTAYTSMQDSGWNYYKCIDEEQQTSQENQNSTNDDDETAALANIAYYPIDNTTYKSIEDVEQYYKDIIYSDKDDEKPSSFEDKIYRTVQGTDVLKIKVVYDTKEYSEVTYLYYSLNKNKDKIAIVSISSSNLQDDAEIEKDGFNIIDSLKWDETDTNNSDTTI